MTMMDLDGKTALITGGATGIGFAVAKILGRRGAVVGINHIAEDGTLHHALTELAKMGVKAHAFVGDISRREEAEGMVARAVATMGGLDYLVNNAGTAATKTPIDFKDLDQLTDDFWRKILETNLLGAFWCGRASAAALKESGGAIVNTASVAGLGIRGSSIAYAASKAALINMTRSIAIALAPDVRVNAVAPGFVDTAWTMDWDQKRRDQALERTLLRRAATPDDIAKAIVFLCADTDYVNAQTLILDGGSI